MAIEEVVLNNNGIGTSITLANTDDRRAASFIPTFDISIKDVTYSLKRIGEPWGSVICRVESDAGGIPDGVVIGTSTLINIYNINNSFDQHILSFNGDLKLLGGERYWFILEYESSVNVISPIKEETNVIFNITSSPAIAELADVKMNNTAGFYDVVGDAKYWLLYAQNGQSYYVWYNVTDGVNTQTDPVIGGSITTKVDILLADTVTQIIQKTITIIDGIAQISSVIEGTDTARITQSVAGDVTDPVDVDSGITVSINTIGKETTIDYDVEGNALYWNITATDGSKFHIWYNVLDGVNTQSDPAISGSIGIKINILRSDTSDLIALKTSTSLNNLNKFTSIQSSSTVVVTQNEAGNVEDIVDENANVTPTVNIKGSSIENVISLNSSGVGNSQYFDTSWQLSPVLTTITLIIISTSPDTVGWEQKAIKAPLDNEVIRIIEQLKTNTGKVVTGLTLVANALDIAKVFFTVTEDIFAAVMDLIITDLENLNNDLFGTGAFQLAIHPFSVIDETKRRKLEKEGKEPPPFEIQYITPRQAVNHAINSFDDKGDGARPQFSDGAAVSAFALLITAKDLGLYISLMEKMAKVWNTKDIKFALKKAKEKAKIWYDKDFDESLTEEEKKAKEKEKNLPPSTGADWQSVRFNQIKALGDIQQQINNTLATARGYTLYPQGVTSLIDSLSRKLKQLAVTVETFQAVVDDLTNIPELAGVHVLNIPLGIGGNNRIKKELPNPEFQGIENDIYRYTFMLMYVGGGPSAGSVEAIRKLIA